MTSEFPAQRASNVENILHFMTSPCITWLRCYIKNNMRLLVDNAIKLHGRCITPVAPQRCGSYFKSILPNQLHRKQAWTIADKLNSGECHQISLLRNQH